MISGITTHRIINVKLEADCASEGAINWIDINVANAKGEKFRFTMFPDGDGDFTLEILEQIRDSTSDAINKAKGV